MARHRVSASIVLDQDVRFTCMFWKRFPEEQGTRLHFNIAYHLQKDDKSERTIQTLEDMLRSYIIDFGGSWDSYLTLDKFSYKKNYHASILMPPYDLFYERKCRAPVCWGEVGQRIIGSIEVVLKNTELIQHVTHRLQMAQIR